MASFKRSVTFVKTMVLSAGLTSRSLILLITMYSPELLSPGGSHTESVWADVAVLFVRNQVHCVHDNHLEWLLLLQGWVSLPFPALLRRSEMHPSIVFTKDDGDAK